MEIIEINGETYQLNELPPNKAQRGMSTMLANGGSDGWRSKYGW